MAIRRIFVVWKHPIFHDSLRLLLKHPGVEWIGDMPDYDINQSEILDTKPDAILIEGDEEQSLNQVLILLEMASWNLIIISLNMNSNKLNVYHREQKTIKETGDLLHLILGNLNKSQKEYEK